MSRRKDNFLQSNSMAHSSGGLIGGSCTGGVFVLCLLMYIIYRFLRSDTRTYPGNSSEIVIRIEAGVSSQQNGASADELPPPYSAFSEPCSIEPVCFSAGKK